jgi:hypothetical protein
MAAYENILELMQTQGKQDIPDSYYIGKVLQENPLICSVMGLTVTNVVPLQETKLAKTLLDLLETVVDTCVSEPEQIKQQIQSCRTQFVYQQGDLVALIPTADRQSFLLLGVIV